MGGLLSGLLRTRQRLTETTGNDYNSWRDRLIIADVGVEVAEQIVAQVQQQLAGAPPAAADFIAVITKRLQRVEAMMAVERFCPFVILVVGVNGCGKTTTIAKLSHAFIENGKRVLLAAGDTFRAAAKAQLSEWADRVAGLTVDDSSGDPASVAFSAVKAGLEKKSDIIIIDTAGRLPTQPHLMAELAKVRRAVNKALPYAPHELLMVVDATLGQNAISQVATFKEAVGLTGLLVTKIDGSSKGGFLLPIAHKFALPIRYAGVGEKIDDLAIFTAHDYAAALLGEPTAAEVATA